LLAAVQGAQQQQRADTRAWYQAYADAQRNIQQRNWQGAIADLEAAARLNAPRPGRRVLFTGDVYRDYNPDYYLGVAYLNLKRYAEADSAFERVKQAQLIAPADAQFKEFTAQASTARFETLMAQAQQDLSANRLDAAESNIQAAKALGVQTARVDVLAKELGTRLLASTVQSAPPVTGGPDTTTAAANTAVNSTNAAADPPPDDTTQQGRGQPPVTPPPAISEPARGGTNIVRTTPPARPPLPRPGEDDRSAMVMFYQGDYQAAVVSLQNIVSVGAPTPRTYFYLACGRAALVLVGLAPRSELDSARADLARAGDTGRLAADLRMISPRVARSLGLGQ
jgi:hypothetical protein